ncbi:MAG: prepilin-type N-terminal cleavage/methylation domain [Armatimonadetes bacterium]|jgi:prepilin-type processing-associated H-X9-DG protein|nr:prepilin-type N-terminal cleavage/methylation domain [Armatimonadota bacterium]
MRRAYTWVELMVTLVLLVVFLMPTINWARPAARKVTCLSNQKQIVSALLQYAEDYDRRLPPHAYITGTRSVLLPALIAPYVKYPRIWLCPSAPASSPFTGRPDDPLVNYGYNWSALTTKERGLPLDRVNHPPSTVAFVEADSYLAAPASLVPALGGSPPVYRHERRINVSWLDGHAKSEAAGVLEETAVSENGARLGSGIDAFTYWNLR